MNVHVEKGLVKFTFVKSDRNILTKSLSVELHEKHSKKMVDEKFEDVFRFKNI